MQIGGSALVTGASRGIGRAVALALADRGFDVVATMRDLAHGDGLAEETAGRLSLARMDVTDPSSITIPDDLRVLVNNAGVDADHTPAAHPRYLPMADALDEARRGGSDQMVVPPAAAAAAIVDAILDDDGPMRYGCDPLGDGMLDLWRQHADEALYAMMSAAFLAP